jgi:hypothetical protein
MRDEEGEPGWPFWKICTKLKEPGSMCHEDLDCELDSYCWYPDDTHATESKKKCMKLYELEDESEFGYKSDDKELLAQKNIYNMFNNLYIGRGCQSGMVTLDDSTKKAKCVRIAHVKTNKDNFAEA